MIKYLIKTGEIFLFTNGKWVFIGTGYSGNGAGLNNPTMQDLADHGPIPCGLWKGSLYFDDIKPPVPLPNHNYKGALVCRLTALTYKGSRQGFMNHGDNASMNFSASDGCIVAPHDVRLTISKSNVEYWIVESGL